MSLTYTLVRECLNNVTDIAGLWQVEGGRVLENQKQVANYSSVKRVSCGTEQQEIARARLACGSVACDEIGADQPLTLTALWTALQKGDYPIQWQTDDRDGPTRT